MEDRLEQRPFFGRVESLRGLGAMAVAAYHIAGMQVHGWVLFPAVAREGAGMIGDALRVIGRVLMPGHAALMIFFVISGLVLRVSLQYGPQDFGRAALRFHIARVFRIYPIVIATAIAVVLLLGWEVPPGPGQSPGPLSIGTFIANMLLLDVSLNTTWWALQVEVLMAPVIVLLYFLERRLGVRALIVIAAVTMLLSFSRQWAIWPPLSRNVFPFVLGMILPTLGRDWALRVSARAARLWAAGATVMLVVPHAILGMFSQWTAVIEAGGAVVLVSLVAYRLDLKALRFLDWRPVRMTGAASGSYYVVHPLAAPFFTWYAAVWIPTSWTEAAPDLVAWGVMIVWLVALAPLAILGFHLIETPGIALGRLVNNAVSARLRRAGGGPVPQGATPAATADRASA